MICTRNCMYTVNGECGLKLTSSDATNRCPLMPDDAPESKPYKPPMTNADRIRAMSDEELAVFMSNEKYDTDDRYITSAWWLKWLQQPCEGGADDE